MNIERKKISTGVARIISILIVMMYKCGGAAVIKTRTTKVVYSQSMRVKKTMMKMSKNKEVVFINNLNISSVIAVKKLVTQSMSVLEIQTSRQKVIQLLIWKESRSSRITEFCFQIHL